MMTKTLKTIASFILMTCAICAHAQSTLTYSSPPLEGEEIATGASFGILDPACPHPDECAYRECFYQSYVRLGVNPLVDESINWDPNQLYEVTVVFDVYYTSTDGDFVVLNDQKLNVSFKNTGGIMKDQHVLTLDGGYDIKVAILDVVMNPSGMPLPASLYMQVEIEYDRFLSLATTTPDVATSDDGDFINFNIDPVSGAHRYEIEWSWLDDELVDPSLDQYNFRLNSTRVLLAPNTLSHKIPNVFRKGNIATRVRAIGRQESCEEWVQGPWNLPEAGDLSALTQNDDYIHVDGHLESFNWQHSRTYAEDGKQKDAVGYADGSLRTRQQVTKLESQDHTIAGETYYDHVGRSTVTVMPIPVLKTTGLAQYENRVTYFPKLNQNLSGESYHREDFEQDLGDCESPAQPMNQNAGAGLYYSENNPDQEGIQAYTPDADGYVISQIIHTQDGTGRTRFQGGVGEKFQIGSGHEMKYYYGTPEQQEIDRLFGNNVGHVNYYFKNLVIDPNGQVAVQYKDNKDRVIATALAGEAPENLIPLSNAGSVTNITSDLSGLNNLENEGTPDASYNLQKQFVVSGNNTAYEFDYTFQPNDFTDSECVPFDCYDCVYNFKMLLFDDCNQLVFGDVNGTRIGPADIDSLCSNDGPFSQQDNTTLDVGSYGLNKILGLDATAMQAYEEQYVSSNICVEDIIDIFYDLLLLADFSSCIDPLCAQSCLTGMDPNDYADIEDFKDDLVACLEECDDITESDVTACDILRLTMIGDMSPYGQYGKVLDENGATSTDASCLSIYSEGNVLGVDYTGVNFVDEVGTPITVLIDGQATSPNEMTLEQFLFFFEASWIENLLKFHPEYCYLNWCEDAVPGSSAFDNFLLTTDDPDVALAEHLLNPVGNNPAAIGYPIGAAVSPVPDPFFTAYPGLLSTMRNQLDNFFQLDGQMHSAWDLAYMISLSQVLDINAIIDAGDIPNPGQWDDEYGSAFCQTKTFWRMFRGIYYSLKKQLEEAELDDYLAANNCCPNDYIGTEEENCAGDVCADFLIAVPRYYGPDDANGGTIDVQHIIDSAQDGDPDFSELEQEQQQYYEANCAAYRDQWAIELQGCADLANLSEAEMTALLDQMEEICRLGSDISHPVGASSTPDPSIVSSGGHHSFEEAMAAAISPESFDSTCNAYLISSPYPYDVNPLGGDDTALWPCACDRYDLIFNEYTVATGNTDITGFHNYLITNYGVEYTVDELASLACLCDNQSTDYVLENPVLLDGVLEPFACINCIDFLELAVLYNTFLTSGDNYFVPVDEGDLENPLYHDNVTGWLNAQLNFNLTYPEYANFFEDQGLNLLTGEYVEEGECADLPDALQSMFHEIFQVASFPSTFDLIGIPGFINSAVDLWSGPGSLPVMNIEILTDPVTGEIYHRLYITINSDGPIVCDMYLYGLDDLNIVTGVIDLTPVFPPGATTTQSFTMNVTLDGGGTATLTGTASCYTFESCTDQLCNRPIYIDGEDLPIDDCLDDLMELLFQEASVVFEDQVDSARLRFRNLYPQQCLANLQESLIKEYDLKEYQYTLYYYDQSQNIVRTIPPEGVHPLTGNQLNGVENHRDGGGPAVYPEHEFVSHYQQNSFNEITTQEMPDAKAKQYWYDNLGRAIVAQDGRQKELTASSGYHTYSYTIYDEQGRITESGELEHKEQMQEEFTLTYISYLGWINDRQSSRYVNRTIYDESYNSSIDNYFDDDRIYLRKRVSSALYFEDGASEKYDYGCHYDYDVHGNVLTMIQEIADLNAIKQGRKRVDYKYDLISGKVHEVWYQHKYADAFYHRYHFDDDNRIVHVETSKDRIIWDRDARYQYYRHGPLARIEMGDKQVQGVDYIFALQGWLKGVNSNTLDHTRDPGHDGSPGDPFNEYRAADVFGYSLGYYQEDFNSIKTFSTSETFHATEPGGLPDLYNGNIARMVTAIKDDHHNLLPTQPNVYRYDQLNRIKETQRFKDLNLATNIWDNGTTSDYNTSYKYDGNGNIMALGRSDAQEEIDALGYEYLLDPVTGHRTNKLNYVKDFATPINPNDPSITSQSNGNYRYDGSGSLISDDAEKIKYIERDHLGNVRHIYRHEGPTEELPELTFEYDAMGSRILKIVKRGKEREDWVFTYYNRDASGNLMALNERRFERPSKSLAIDRLFEKEFHLYGSERVGIKNSDKSKPLAEAKRKVNSPVVANATWTPGFVLSLTLYQDPEPDNTDRYAGLRNYELSNHLGNVLSVVSDNKLLAYSGSALPKFNAEVLSFSDYYPFGMLMPERHGSSELYRYGYNGMEKDDEWSGAGNSYTTTYRQYDPRIARWKSVDPLAKKLPWESPYVAMNNKPIIRNDVEGDCPTCILGFFISGIMDLAFQMGEHMLLDDDNIEEAFDKVSWLQVGGQASLGAFTGMFDGGVAKFAAALANPKKRKILTKVIEFGMGALLDMAVEYGYDVSGIEGKIYGLLGKDPLSTPDIEDVGRKMAKKDLLKKYGDDVIIADEIYGTFGKHKGGTRFDFVVYDPKQDKILEVVESKASTKGSYTLTDQQKKYYFDGKEVEFTGKNAKKFELTGKKVSTAKTNSTVFKTKVHKYTGKGTKAGARSFLKKIIKR